MKERKFTISEILKVKEALFNDTKRDASLSDSESEYVNSKVNTIIRILEKNGIL